MAIGGLNNPISRRMDLLSAQIKFQDNLNKMTEGFANSAEGALGSAIQNSTKGGGQQQ